MNQDYISSRYQLTKKIGQGGQGSVWLGQSNRSGKEVAIKLIDITPANQKNVFQEILALKSISKPNCNPYVACYYDSFYDPTTNQAVIEMEYIKGPNIAQYTQPLRSSANRPLLIKTTKLFLKATLIGLKFIHSHGVLHNDIKPNNIVVSPAKVPIIVDFGISCFVQNALNSVCTSPYNKIINNCCNSMSGTSIYLPPEVIRDVRYPSSDLWSLGATAYEIMSGMNIWGINVLAYDPYQLVGVVTDKFRTNTLPNKLVSGDSVLDTVVNGFLVYDPSLRLTIDQALTLLG